MKQINKTEFIRVEKTKNYTVIHNQFLRRKDLSWKAKGILTYVLSLPDDWNINLEEVMQHATEGKSAFRSGWKELRDAGYVKRQPVKDKYTKKILHWETVVFENVDMSTSEPHTDYPPSGKPVDGKPDSGKSNTTKYLKELSTNIQSTNKDSPDSTNVKYDDDSPYLGLAKHLFTKVKENNSKAREPNFQNWADDIRKLVEIDGNTVEEVKEVIDWCQSDSFWKNNVMSANKLRNQFPKLWGQGGFENKGSIGIEDLWRD